MKKNRVLLMKNKAYQKSGIHLASLENEELPRLLMTSVATTKSNNQGSYMSPISSMKEVNQHNSLVGKVFQDNAAIVLSGILPPNLKKLGSLFRNDIMQKLKENLLQSTNARTTAGNLHAKSKTMGLFARKIKERSGSLVSHTILGTSIVPGVASSLSPNKKPGRMFSQDNSPNKNKYWCLSVKKQPSTNARIRPARSYIKRKDDVNSKLHKSLLEAPREDLYLQPIIPGAIVVKNKNGELLIY